FKPTELLDRQGDKITVGVSNIFAQSQFEAKFNEQIKAILKKNGIKSPEVKYVVATSGKKTTINRETTTRPTVAVSQDRVIDDLVGPNPRSRSSQSADGLNPRYKFDNFIVGSSNDL